MPRHLRTIGASFWDRGDHLPIGRLPPHAAAAAIRIPLEDRDWSIGPDALREVVEESHGYPFFVQLWGEQLWAASSNPDQPACRADVRRVRAEVERRTDQFYANRYMKLEEAGLTGVAAGVAAVFADSQRTTIEQVRQAIRCSLELQGRAADSKTVEEATARLYDLGFIWSVVDQSALYYEPGIPSLMTFVERNYRAATRGASA